MLMRDVLLIVIHCSASRNGAVLTVDQIDHEHARRGFKRSPEFLARQNPKLKSIGYHFVVYVNGALATGRHLDEVGAHVKGYNQKSIGICMAGGMDEHGKATGQFTPAQWETLKGCVASLQKLYPGVKLVGHRDLSPDLNGDGVIEQSEWMKECPAFDVASWIDGGMAPLDGHIFQQQDEQTA